MSEIEKAEMLHTKVLSFVTKQYLEGENTIESYYKLIEVFEASEGVDYPNNHNVQVKEHCIDDTIEMILLKIEIMFKEVDLLIEYNNSLIGDKLKSVSSMMSDNNTILEKLTTPVGPSPEDLLIKMIENGTALPEDVQLTTQSLTNIEDGLIKTIVYFKPTLSTINKILQVQKDKVTGKSNEPIEDLIVIGSDDITIDNVSIGSYTTFISLYDNYDCQIVLINNETNETYISDSPFRVEKILQVLEQ